MGFFMNKVFDRTNLRISEFFRKTGAQGSELAKKYDVQLATAYNWINGYRVPPINVLLDLCEKGNTNLSYLLALTAVDAPLETYSPYNRIDELRKERGMKIVEFQKTLNTTLAVYHRYADEENRRSTTGRISTLVTFSTFFGVSIDYLLGLTEYRTWKHYLATIDPFIFVEPGTPALVKYKSEEGDEVSGYILMHENGKYIISSEGMMISKTSPDFDDVIVMPCKINEED